MPSSPRALLALAVLLWAGLLPAGRAAAARPAFEMFPDSNLYPSYVADPRHPGFGVTLLGFPDPRIPDSGDRRVGLKLGGRFGLLRVGRWQADIEAGFTGQFDIEHSLDNIGWDGTYGFLVSTVLAEGVSVQLGTKHISSHVGDEYAERTGRRRIEYTREELAAGIAWAIEGRWRTYAEAGWGFAPRDEIGQEPGRLQLGLEHEAPGSLGPGRLGWYAALDLGALEEKDWQVDPTFQAGLLIPAGDRRWRVGLGIHGGTVPIGEFFRVDETYVALGLWLDP
jgi:opacity protein-like surface antigen